MLFDKLMVTLSTLLEAATPYGVPVARALLAAVFLYSGWQKLWYWQDSVKEVTALGLPFAPLFAAGTIAIQLAGGLAVISGFAAAFGAAILAAFTIAATLLGHRFWLLHGDAAKRELTTSLEHLGIVGGLVLVIIEALQGS